MGTSATHSPYNRLKRVGLRSVRWTRGFWARWYQTCKDVTIWSIHEAMNDPQNSAVLTNFAVAAGTQEGRHRGTRWSDGDCYKWLEALAHIYALTGDEKLDQTMDRYIEQIAGAQAEDGYINTQIQLTDRSRWADPQHHELYNMGHLMTAAAVHHLATGKNSLVAVAMKAADYLYRVFKPRPKHLVHFGMNPSNIMGLVDLYRVTYDPKYLELAGIFVDMRGASYGGTDHNQNRTPLRNESEAVGHAVMAMYLYCGATDVYSETGESSLLDALERIWDNVTHYKMYVTGGVGACHWGVSSRHDLVHEAFGREYELPNATAYNETCANIASAMWNLRMLHVTGEACFADEMERVAYNSMLSGISLDGERFFYTNPLARWKGQPMLMHDTEERWSRLNCYCCPPQIARTLASINQWAYSVSDEGLWVHLYASNEVRVSLPYGSGVIAVQETDYPWDGHVRIVVKMAPDRPVSLMLRIPGWASGARAALNGEPIDGARLGEYLKIENVSTNDEVELDLPMEIRRIKAHPRVESAQGQVCIMRGPLVYCFESKDLPEEVRLSEIRLPRDAALQARWDSSLLGGVVVIEGDGERVVGEPLQKAAAAIPEAEVSIRLGVRIF